MHVCTRVRTHTEKASFQSLISQIRATTRRQKLGANNSVQVPGVRLDHDFCLLETALTEILSQELELGIEAT